MHLLIDLQSCQSGSRLGGIGRYSLELAKSMALKNRGHRVSILLNSALGFVNEVRNEFLGVVEQADIFVLSLPENISYINSTSAMRIASELLREHAIRLLDPDLLHISSYVEGYAENVVTSLHGLFPADRTAVTIYDLIPLVEEETYLADARVKLHYLSKVEGLKNAGAALAISDYSMREAIQYLGLKNSNVANISSGIDTKFSNLRVDSKLFHKLRVEHGITGKYFLFTGSFDKRKNHKTLIEAYSLLARNVISNYQLVIAGNGWPGVYEELKAIARQNELEEGHVIFTGRVTDNELAELYRNASLLVFPSFREGFGLPVVEAMSMGTPAIASNTTSLPEVVGWVEAMFDPNDAKDISSLMAKFVEDKEFALKLRKHANLQANKFTWTKSASLAWDHFEKYLSSNFGDKAIKSNFVDKDLLLRDLAEKLREFDFTEKYGEVDAWSFSKSIYEFEKSSTDFELKAKQGLKIAWVSTWNTKCGIAEYTANLLSGIENYSHIFAPQNQEQIMADSKNVFRSWEVGGGSLVDLTEQLIQGHYDLVAIQLNYGFFDFQELQNLIFKLKHMQVRVCLTLHSTIDPDPILLPRSISEIKDSLQILDKIFVHTISDCLNLEKLSITDNVELLPQGIPLFAKTEENRNTEKEKSLTLATYGFLLPHKGFEELLVAIKFLIESGMNLRLKMINATHPAKESSGLLIKIKEFIEKNDLNDNVEVHFEFLNHSQTKALFEEVDLAIFPYQETNESSSAAVRVPLAFGVPVLTTPNEIFKDISRLAITSSGFSPESLGKAIQEYFEDDGPDAPARMNFQENLQIWKQNCSAVAAQRQMLRIL